MFAPVKHWKVRALAQKLLWTLPGGVRLNAIGSSLLAGHDPRRELFDKHLPYLQRHLHVLARLGLADLAGRSALEIGTGWDLNIALLLRHLGCSDVTTADAFRHVRLGQVRRMLWLLAAADADLPRSPHTQPLDWQALLAAPSVEALCTLAAVRYVAPVSANYDELADHSVDFCYSTAVFEHIRPAAAEAILRVTRRKLKPGGFTTHVIDLKDHFAYFQPGLPYNNFLRFSAREWDYWAGNPMSYTNRIPASGWREIFTRSGYEIVHFEEREETTLPALPPAAIHPENRHWTERDLRVGELHVVARVPA